jgi:hypothetical protein
MQTEQTEEELLPDPEPEGEEREEDYPRDDDDRR